MTDTVGSDAWSTVGRASVADRIDQDADEIGETFAATAAKVRRGESLDPEDVEGMRRELERAEYLLDDVLEPIAESKPPERACGPLGVRR